MTWIKENNGKDIPIPEQLFQNGVVDTFERNIGNKLSQYEALLKKWLTRYTKKEVAIRKNESGQLEIPIENLPTFIPRLPEGYGYKGGAARTILEYALGLPISPPRDLDIVFVGESEDVTLSDDLAEKYMPDDFENGYGVEPLEEDYFGTRDFTLNEVLYDGGKIICTRKCLTDLLRNIIRFTDYEKHESYTPDREFYIYPKLLAKAVRMVALARTRGHQRARITREIGPLRGWGIDDFHLALHLDRAMEQGPEVAKAYMDIMHKNGIIPSEIQSVNDFFKYLMTKTDFIFRCAPPQEIEEDKFIPRWNPRRWYLSLTYTTMET